jgi:hypothetical protein
MGQKRYKFLWLAAAKSTAEHKGKFVPKAVISGQQRISTAAVPCDDFPGLFHRTRASVPICALAAPGTKMCEHGPAFSNLHEGLDDGTHACVRGHPRFARPGGGELHYRCNRCLCVHSHILTHRRFRTGVPSCQSTISKATSNSSHQRLKPTMYTSPKPVTFGRSRRGTKSENAAGAGRISDWRDAWLCCTLAVHELEATLRIIRKQLP